MKSLELRELRAKEIHDARSIMDKVEAEKRDLTSEENASVDALFLRADELESKIDSLEKRERLEVAESRLKESSRQTRPTLHRSEEAPDSGSALRCWLARGVGGVRTTGADLDNAVRCGVDLSSNELTITRNKVSKRTMDKGTSSALVAWTDLYQGFYSEMKSFGPVLDLINYRDSDNANPLPIPVMDDTSNMAAILAENGATTAADPVGSNVVLGGFKWESKEIIVSLELLQDSSVDLEAYIGSALAERFGRGWARAASIGVGTTEPFGLVTRATASGVVSTGSGAAPTVTGDHLIDLADSLDDAYKVGPKVGYMMAPTTISKVRKLKDSNGQYLWQPSLQMGVPATFNGFAVYRNQNMVSTGVNAKLAVFEDFSKYLWRNVMGIQFFKLDQLRIRNAQISFLAFARADGNLIQPNAVKSLAAPAA